MKNKLKIIKKVLKSKCYRCEGLGIIGHETTLNNNREFEVISIKCPICNGIKKYEENHYIISDGKNAIDSDTLK